MLLVLGIDVENEVVDGLTSRIHDQLVQCNPLLHVLEEGDEPSRHGPLRLARCPSAWYLTIAHALW